MEEVTAILEKAQTFFVTLVTTGNEFLVLAAAGLFFFVGVILLYRKGPGLGVPFALAGILLVVMAILAKLLSF